METLLEVLPWLIAMVVLIACSAFFSASEAALFSLRQQDRRFLKAGTRAQRLAADLLDDPDRLLSAVLFWNLLVNVAYFTITSIVSLGLEREGRGGEAGRGRVVWAHGRASSGRGDVAHTSAGAAEASAARARLPGPR